MLLLMMMTQICSGGSDDGGGGGRSVAVLYSYKYTLLWLSRWFRDGSYVLLVVQGALLRVLHVVLGWPLPLYHVDHGGASVELHEQLG
jgi:hypothetical protein